MSRTEVMCAALAEAGLAGRVQVSAEDSDGVPLTTVGVHELSREERRLVHRAWIIACGWRVCFTCYDANLSGLAHACDAHGACDCPGHEVLW